MRKLIVVGCLALCTPSLARERNRSKQPAHVVKPAAQLALEDEPMPATQKPIAQKPVITLDAGQLRDNQLAAPRVADVGETPGTVVARGVMTDDPAKGRADQYEALSGVQEELAERQMRKHQASIDKCVADARHVSPALTGAVSLKINVGERQVASAEIAANSMTDPAAKDLEGCLLTAAKTWTFSLSHASFTHAVVVSPVVSR